MNASEFAEQLTGIEYPCRIDRDLIAKAKAAGIVIVYGASDDLMEFEGAINDEVGVYDGGIAYLDDGKLLENPCSEPECPYFAKIKETAPFIEALWCTDEDAPAWTYETAIPHATFDVMEDGVLYCRGIVFALADVPK